MRLRFERGTLVLEDPPPGLEVSELPGALWDPRIRRYRAAASAYAPLCRALAERGVELEDQVYPRRLVPEAWAEVELRPYQEAALEAWQLAGYRGTVVLPTGSGKTRVAIAAIARLGLSALCLVPTRVLLDQWRRALADFYSGPVGVYGDGNHRVRAITVSTYASAERHMDRFGDRFAVVVADEVHNAVASVDTFLMSSATARLGLTATPPSRPEALDALGELVGPVVYELAIGDLSGSFLAPFDLVTLMLDLDRLERRRYESEMSVFRRAYRRFKQSSPDGDWVGFLRAASRSDEGRRAVASWRQARRLLHYTAAKRQAVGQLLRRHTGSKTLVFAPDNQTAYAIARDHLVMPITCDIRRSERAEALERFARGELRGLVSARVLNEGIDVPDADVAIVVGGTLGEREHVQRLGRVLRPSEGKRAVIYEMVTPATTEVRRARQRRAGLAPRVSAQL